MLLRPCDIAVAVVVALQGELDVVHVNWALHVGSFQASRKILDTHVDGILRVYNTARMVQEARVVGTFGKPVGAVISLTSYLPR